MTKFDLTVSKLESNIFVKTIAIFELIKIKEQGTRVTFFQARGFNAERYFLEIKVQKVTAHFNLTTEKKYCWTVIVASIEQVIRCHTIKNFNRY